MGSSFTDKFVHDGRYVKAGRNFLKLDSLDNVLIQEINNSASKKFLVLTLAEFKKKVGSFHKVKTVGQDEVDNFVEDCRKFKETELKCDSHNSKELKKIRIKFLSQV